MASSQQRAEQRRVVGLLATAFALAGAACPGESAPLPETGATGCKTVQVFGRVVDIETCLTAGGCQGVQDLRVGLFYDASIVSDKTRPDGACQRKGVPNGVRNYLMVTDATGTGTYLTTLQAASVTTKGSEVYGVELHTLKREGGLYAAISQEASIDIATHAIYFGQVFALSGGTMKAYLGATATSSPSSSIRYVNCNPRIKSPPCPTALFDDKRTTTGPFGEFVSYGPASTGDLAVGVSATGTSFNPLLAPVGVGYITIGLHQSKSGSTGDAGPQDAAKSH